MDKFDFMSLIAEILSEFKTEELDDIGKQMKNVIDNQVKLEKEYAKMGLR
ncbi:hypothetical protein [Terrisporobacter muris]|uniref:Uncharacterized protein n=1 Tax=Terrisporobacter muris TaxID=2963284 RepID=A0A9X2S184_9FIRM|nr:hypothetical protein [Terrisporobacter muris]MCR1822748.1 hypothetical protein [Terrisporobacter muris]